jgi:hypothetical protein
MEKPVHSHQVNRNPTTVNDIDKSNDKGEGDTHNHINKKTSDLQFPWQDESFKVDKDQNNSEAHPDNPTKDKLK